MADSRVGDIPREMGFKQMSEETMKHLTPVMQSKAVLLFIEVFAGNFHSLGGEFFPSGSASSKHGPPTTWQQLTCFQAISMLRIPPKLQIATLEVFALAAQSNSG